MAAVHISILKDILLMWLKAAEKDLTSSSLLLWRGQKGYVSFKTPSGSVRQIIPL